MAINLVLIGKQPFPEVEGGKESLQTCIYDL